MIRFIIRRSLGAIVVLIVVSFITFVIFQLAPFLSHSLAGLLLRRQDPVPAGLVAAQVARAPLRLRPAVVPAVLALAARHLLRSDAERRHRRNVYCNAPCFGYSFQQNTPVGSLIWQALPVSLSLAVGAATLWLVGGVLIGTLSGLRPGSIIDRVGMTLALGGVSLPIFFTGPVLLLIFEYQLKWLNEPRVREPHKQSAAVAREHDPALDRARVPLRGPLRPAHPREHARDDG